MNKTKLIFTLGLSLCFLFTNCSKTEDPQPDQTQNNNTNNNPAPNHLCDGDKSATYWPIKEGNSWSTKSLMGTNTVSTFTGTDTMGGRTYNVLVSTDNFGSRKNYFRADASGNIYEYVIYKNTPEFTKEYMVIPGNATVGTEWEFAPVFY